MILSSCFFFSKFLCLFVLFWGTSAQLYLSDFPFYFSYFIFFKFQDFILTVPFYSNLFLSVVMNIILFLWEYYSLKHFPFFIVSVFFFWLIWFPFLSWRISPKFMILLVDPSYLRARHLEDLHYGCFLLTVMHHCEVVKWSSRYFILKLKNVSICRFVLLGCSISPEKNPPISCLESIHIELFLGVNQWKEAGSLTFWMWSPFGLVSSPNESFISFWVGEGLSLASARGGKEYTEIYFLTVI